MCWWFWEPFWAVALGGFRRFFPIATWVEVKSAILAVVVTVSVIFATKAIFVVVVRVPTFHSTWWAISFSAESEVDVHPSGWGFEDFFLHVQVLPLLFYFICP